MTDALPDEWDVVPLEDLLVGKRDLTYGVVQPGPAMPGGVPIVRVGDIRDGRVNLSSPMRVQPEIEAKYLRSRLEGGELLVTLVGTVGQCAIATNEMRGWNVARAVAVARIRDDVGARWVARLLRVRDALAHIDSRLNTTVQATLNLSDLRRIPVVVPPRHERDRISRIADALDDKIDSNGRARDAVFALLDAMIAKAAPELPVTVLAELAQVLRRTVNPAGIHHDAVDLYSLPAFDAGALPERVHPSTIKSSKISVTRRSVLLSRLNPRFNRTWGVTPEPGIPALASTEFLCLTADDDVGLAAVWLAIRDEHFRAELASRVTGTSGSHQRVRLEDALAIEVPDTSRLSSETLQAVVRLLDVAEQLRSEAHALAKLRDTLLPELLSGRVRVLGPAHTSEEVVA